MILEQIVTWEVLKFEYNEEGEVEFGVSAAIFWFYLRAEKLGCRSFNSLKLLKELGD